MQVNWEILLSMLGKSKYWLYLIPVLCLCASCMSTRKLNYLQPAGHGIPEYADTIEYQDYKLQKGDYLYIQIYSPNPDEVATYNGYMSQNNARIDNTDVATARLYMYLIGEDGCINYPYVGKIQALGKTTRDVKFALEDALRESVSTFSVDVKLSNRSFSILGESGSGRFAIPKEKLNIFQALAMCGDMSHYAKRNEIQIIRQTETGTVVRTFDLRTQSIINSEFYYIQPNDVIYVPFDNAKFFGVQHFTGILSLTMSTISFGVFIYGIVTMITSAAAQ